MGLKNKIKNKIKESVPEEYRDPEAGSKNFGKFEPIEEEKDSKKTTSNASPGEQMSEVDTTIRQLNYINRKILEAEKDLDASQRELDTLTKRISNAKRNILVLKTIKSDDLKLDVRWLFNRIGELKDIPDGLDQLEDEFFSFIEQEIENNESRTKK